MPENNDQNSENEQDLDNAPNVGNDQNVEDDSDLTNQELSHQELRNTVLKHFNYLSLIFVLLFSFLTLGLYQAYWFYSRCYKINEFYETKISVSIINGFFGIFVIYYVANFFPQMLLKNPELYFFLLVAYLVFYIALILQMKNCFTHILQSKLNGVWAFLFGVFYFQYKINKVVYPQ